MRRGGEHRRRDSHTPMLLQPQLSSSNLVEAHLCHRPGLQSKHFGVLITACISAVPGEERVRETIKGGGARCGTVVASHR